MSFSPSSHLTRCFVVPVWIVAFLFLQFLQAAEPSGPAGRSDPDTNSPVGRALRQAATLFEQEHWLEARAAYDVVPTLETNWSTPAVKLAVEGAISCSFKLEHWEDCLRRAEEFIRRTEGTLSEAVGERFLGGLYLTVPHYGTRRGSTFLRGQRTQGVWAESYRKDSRDAVVHYERARELLIAYRPRNTEERDVVTAERIGVNFDLVSALSHHNHSRRNFYNWNRFDWWWLSAFETEEESEALAEADYDEPRHYRHWSFNEDPPTGIPLDANGEPEFVQSPQAYSAQLPPGPKIRFLLDEIESIDTSSEKNEAARALFRRAMIARTLYGPDSTSGYSRPVRYDRLGRSLPEEADPDEPAKKIWELAEDETITLVGAQRRLLTLPSSESPVALLREIERKYPDSEIRPEAHYTRALYFQTRQQFPEAVGEYRAFLEAYPGHKRAADAYEQIRRIAESDLVLDQSGLWLPGERPRIAFTHRNVDTAEFRAVRFDLVKYVQDSAETPPTNDFWSHRNLEYYFFKNDGWKSYLGREVAQWTEQIAREPGNRTGTGVTLAPFTEPGAYLVEAAVPGKRGENSRLLVLLTDIAIVQKNVPDEGLIYVADARTGQPLTDKAVRLYEHWSEYDQRDQKRSLFWDSTVVTTDTNGVVLYRRKHAQRGSRVDAVVTGEGDRMAFSFFQDWNESAHAQSDYWENGPRDYMITDRPVYRPGTTVRFRVWSREIQERAFVQPEAGRTLTLFVHDAKDNQVDTLTLTTDEFGGASGEFTLGEEPPLGVWHFRIEGRAPDGRQSAGALFRVEEYRKPEFEVAVTPAKSRARLGETISATIEARYYFGAPVAQATVSYKVFREDYQHVYFGPAEYDWLYGAGYGRYDYAYHWFPWWGRWGGFICNPHWPGPRHRGQTVWFPWGPYGTDPDAWRRVHESGTRKALRELVSKGEGRLRADGTFEVQIDTSRARLEQSDRDHRYTVEAEVRDDSRRTVEGQGSVLATRQEFYAFVETDGGWYQPRREAYVEVRTLSPDNTPVAVAGEVIVKRISYGGASNDTPDETVVTRWNAETDAQGRLSFRYAIPGEGQYRITFLTHDSARDEVQGNAVFWVNGPRFDGRVYRFNDLEIIADKRTYKVGETARLLINVAENHSRILFSDHVTRGVMLNWRFIDIPARSTVIDVSIEEKHVPNFYLEATLVRNGRVHTESRELFVPPADRLLNVALQTDQSSYRPGDTGRVSVAVTDANGRPVQGQITLAAYDKAVTYIQDEFGPDPRTFFYGRKRYHTPVTHSSMERVFHPSSYLQRPEWYVAEGGEPEGWRGWWLLRAEGMALYKQDSFAFATSGMGGGGGGGGGFDAASSSERVLTRNRGGMFLTGAVSAVGGVLNSSDISKRSESGGMTGAFIEPEVRVNFADTALWLPALSLDATGRAETEIQFPQSLTTWRLRAYAVTKSTQVGDTSGEAITTKNLLVRLQAPRFFVERDEVVLSANVHNYLATDKKVQVELTVPSDIFEALDLAGNRTSQGASAPGDARGASQLLQRLAAPAVHTGGAGGDDGGVIRLTLEAEVKANGEHRFNWPVRVKQSGFARITVKALTDEESDGVALAFPVLVHGVQKTLAQSGAYRVGDQGAHSIQLDLPRDIDPEKTRLEITLSPSLAGVMIDALPYLVGYPYGCVEQTMSRFYPSVLVKETLRKMGTDLETIGRQRRQMNTNDLENRFRTWQSPVFDSGELDRIVRAGLDRIYSLQRNDGGWGWWREDESSPYQTAYVIQGLRAARNAGVIVDSGVFDRGLEYLQNATEKEIALPEDQQRLGALQTQAYLAYILATEKRLEAEELKSWFTMIYERRGDLNQYGRALLALALHAEGRTEEAQTVLRNVLQYVERDDSNETAWVRTTTAHWWFWWNNDIEVNAWALKALVTIDPQSDLAPRLVKWLLNNRRNGHYWRSTRDTALVISAMTDFMQASGEIAPDYALTVEINGQPVSELKLTRDNFFTFENRIALHGLHLKPGPQKITLTKKGEGALYYSAYLSYFTKEEDVKGAGNEIAIEREYFKLVPATEQVIKPARRGFNWFIGARHPAGQLTRPETSGRRELRDIYTRVPLKNGDAVASGDKIEVVLKLTAKNSYDYLAFEDMKPAGCEPVELRSGGRWAGGLVANMELRDEKVVFFIGLLEQGEHVLRYKLRAETPGHFHALPTKGFAMYAPEINAISDEHRLRITD